MDFNNHVILVTGATGGIGRALTRAFADKGGRVVATDLDESVGRELVADVGRDAEFMPLDVTDETAWQRVLDEIDEKLGGLNILVNNAGFFQPNVSFEDMPLSLWRKHFAINSDGIFLGCKHGILRLKQRGGSIVNIGSGMSIKAQATASAYCGSKAAALMTTRTAAASAGAYGIRVNAVLLGPVETPMLMSNIVEGQGEDEFLQQLSNHSPLHQLATPEDIARAVLFLADPANRVVTGTYLTVDGGNLLAH